MKEKNEKKWNSYASADDSSHLFYLHDEQRYKEQFWNYASGNYGKYRFNLCLG